jgi:hypothetical protein
MASGYDRALSGTNMPHLGVVVANPIISVQS